MGKLNTYTFDTKLINGGKLSVRQDSHLTFLVKENADSDWYPFYTTINSSEVDDICESLKNFLAVPEPLVFPSGFGDVGAELEHEYKIDIYFHSEKNYLYFSVYDNYEDDDGDDIHTAYDVFLDRPLCARLLLILNNLREANK